MSPNQHIKVENTYHTSCSNQQHHNDFDMIENDTLNDYNPYNNCCENPNCEHFQDEFDVYYSPNFYQQNNSQSKFRSQPYRPGFQNQKRMIPQNPRINSRPYPNSRFNDGRPPTKSEFKSLKDVYSSDLNIPNPKNNKGNFTVCRRCKSTYHWLCDCPHNDVSKSSSFYTRNLDEEVYIALLQSSCPTPQDQISDLVKETLSHGVIDSGCSKTVAGENWLKDYLETLSSEEVSNIQYENSSAYFRFGDSPPVLSLRKVLLPVVMGGENVKLETEIVKSDIPLLLSRDTMIAAKAQMDFPNASVTLFGKTQKLLCTDSGHYAIPISNSNKICEDPKFFSTVLYTIEENKDVKVLAKKLHHQFGHPPVKRIMNLVKSAGIENKDLFTELEQIDVNCNTCKRYKKASPRPIVSFPLAKEFNETAIDLKVYENNKTYFLHVIDHHTRL